MKKLLIAIVAAVALTGCAVKKSMFYSAASSVDYRPYTDKGFFLSEATSVNFEYAPISSVTAVVISGYTDKDVVIDEPKKKNDNGYPDRADPVLKNFKKASPQDVLDELYRQAIEMGANGIINLNIKASTEEGKNSIGQPMILQGYTATGMAIKK